MSDLSLPSSIVLEPAGPSSPRDEKAPSAMPFTWPTPPYATYPEPLEQRAGEPCEVEGLNGQAIRGRLIFFVPEEQVAHVQVPPSRTTVPLRFNQFRSLTLLEPLQPRNEELADSLRGQALRERPRSVYAMTWADGDEVEGETIGHVEADVGVFLFPPVDDHDAVRRVFVPRDAYRDFEFGSRLDELLIDSHAATLDQVERAEAEQQRLRDQRLGDILVIKQAVTREQLLVALEQQNRMPMVRIGEALMALGLIEQAQLAAALDSQKSDRSVPLGEIMVRLGLVSRQDLQTALSRKMGYPLVDVRQFPIDSDALRRVAAPLAKRLRALPLMLRGASLVVAISDPTRRSALEELEFVAGCKIVPVLAQHGDLDEALRLAYQKIGADAFGPSGDAVAPDPSIDFDVADAGKLLESLEREQLERARPEDDKQIEQSDNSLVRLINQMIVEAHAQGVSDIHVESHPGREKVKIRFRKDGVLHPYLELPHNYRSALTARIKIMCDLDISERRKPQDGKINFAKFAPGHRLELRVATIPTHSGLEDVVLRLLTSAKPIPLDGLGLSPRNLAALKEAAERPYGLVLCVGPTGSGKTTTLHSALSHINVPERKIWTAEDPIEITQPGLRQVQVHPKIDWTFAKALRAFLRADPDVIMVGEVRDVETAQMAIEASLTGHLVMSTLHTNSAPETVTRLLDMGMDPFNFADALLAVLGQRLVRRLCTHCRTTSLASDAEIDELADDWLQVMGKDDTRFSRASLRSDWTERFGRDGQLVLHASPGCAHCNRTGYLGRAAIQEMMVVSREIRHLIQTGARVAELQRAAIEGGMRTLRQDGIEKVLAGLTSIEEVRATSNC